MASFAELDEKNFVLRVIGVSNEVCGEPSCGFPQTEILGKDFIANILNLGTSWVQTSFNNNFRKQYAGIGYSYDETADVFIAPKPFASWLLDENYDWQAPIDYPADGKDYSWDEANQVWVELPAI
jgi:hypothetical protein